MEKFEIVLIDSSTQLSTIFKVDANMYVGSIGISYQKINKIDMFKFSTFIKYHGTILRDDKTLGDYCILSNGTIQTKLYVYHNSVNILVKVKYSGQITVFHYIPMYNLKSWGDLVFQCSIRMRKHIEFIELFFRGKKISHARKSGKLIVIGEKEMVIVS